MNRVTGPGAFDLPRLRAKLEKNWRGVLADLHGLEEHFGPAGPDAQHVTQSAMALIVTTRVRGCRKYEAYGC